MGGKAVEAEQPVGLIEAMLPQQRRRGERREAAVAGARNIGGVVDPLQFQLVVQPLRQGDDIAVALRRGADDQLGTLPGRGKAGRTA